MSAALFAGLGGGALAGLGSLLGGGQSLPFSASKATNTLNYGVKLPNGMSIQDMFAGRAPYSGTESQRGLALGALGDYQSWLDKYLPDFRKTLDSILANSRSAAGNSGALGGLNSGIDEVRSMLGLATGDLASARAAIPALSRERIASSTADIARSLRSRGLAGGSGLEAELISSVIPNTVGDELAAQANIEGQLANTRLGAANTLAGLFGNRAGLQSSEAGRQLGVESSLAPQLEQAFLNLLMSGPQARLSTLAQPGAIYANPSTKFSATGQNSFVPTNQTSSNLASLFGNVGGSLLNYGLASSLFGGGGGQNYGSAGSYFANSGNPLSMQPVW